LRLPGPRQYAVDRELDRFFEDAGPAREAAEQAIHRARLDVEADVEMVSPFVAEPGSRHPVGGFHQGIGRRGVTPDPHQRQRLVPGQRLHVFRFFQDPRDAWFQRLPIGSPPGFVGDIPVFSRPCGADGQGEKPLKAAVHHTPMSSFQSSGLPVMKPRISATQVGSWETSTCTPRDRSSSSSPMKVRFSPTTIFGIPYRRMAPLHIAQGDKVV
jgi:hypothetical protein